MSYSRNIKFITSEAEEDLLNIPEIKELVMEMINCNTEEEFKKTKKTGIIMDVTIFTKNTRVKINDELFNDLIENVVYTTGNYTRIHSIKLETATQGTISFKMRGE